MSPSDFNLHRAAYSADDLREVLSLGKTSIWAAVKDGRLRATRYGKRTLFLAADVAAFLSNLRGEAA